MKQYTVKIPIAGHFVVEVEAENKAQAIEKAWRADPESGEAAWDMIETFCSGNVCYCPAPWEPEAEEC